MIGCSGKEGKPGRGGFWSAGNVIFLSGYMGVYYKDSLSYEFVSSILLYISVVFHNLFQVLLRNN